MPADYPPDRNRNSRSYLDDDFFFFFAAAFFFGDDDFLAIDFALAFFFFPSKACAQPWEYFLVVPEWRTVTATYLLLF